MGEMEHRRVGSGVHLQPHNFTLSPFCAIREKCAQRNRPYRVPCESSVRFIYAFFMVCKRRLDYL